MSANRGGVRRTQSSGSAASAPTGRALPSQTSGRHEVRGCRVARVRPCAEDAVHAGTARCRVGQPVQEPGQGADGVADVRRGEHARGVRGGRPPGPLPADHIQYDSCGCR
ncbi:hypothetical protein [Streptomyces sp. CoH27]|uniref:hypothetical protein n=1 Tax=Streptomyces sp. CoH27 TaxID=2875763 RepID=UPI001CD1F9C5|nr:hypothetical protein [Streptomyces sp. CoH27]